MSAADEVVVIRPAAARAGDGPVAVTVAYLGRDCWVDLVSYARVNLGPYALDSEDVVCDALAMVLGGHITIPDDQSEAIAFTKVVIRNLAMHVIRRRARFETLPDDIIAAKPNCPWERARNAQLHRDVESALEQLSPSEEEIVRRRFMFDEAIVSIAASRGVKPQTIKELERRGLRKLRKRLAMYRDL